MRRQELKALFAIGAVTEMPDHFFRMRAVHACASLNSMREKDSFNLIDGSVRFPQILQLGSNRRVVSAARNRDERNNEKCD